MGNRRDLVVEVYVPQLSKRLDLKMNNNMRIGDLIAQIHFFIGSDKGPGMLSDKGTGMFYDPEKTALEQGIRTGKRILYWY